MTLATWLTVLRLALVPVFALAFRAPLAQQQVFASVVLALAGLTDILDGRLARSRKEESLAGRLLDPLADKLVVLTGVGLLIWAGRLRPWIGLVLIGKETLLVVGAIIFYVNHREMLPSTWLGKTAAVLLYAGLFLGILAPRLAWASEMVILIGLAFSLTAGVSYGRRAVNTATGRHL